MNTGTLPILAMQRPILAMQTPLPKKVIPITLSLSGPVPSPSISVMNAFNAGPAAFEMGATGKLLEIPPVRAPVLQTVPLHTPIAPTALVRTPVTQILHRTLQQRQQQALLLSQRTAATTNTVSKGNKRIDAHTNKDCIELFFSLKTESQASDLFSQVQISESTNQITHV